MRRLKALLVVFGLFFHMSPANALDLGLTPNHVFNIWTNINATLELYVKSLPRYPEINTQFKNLKLFKFAGKKPSDVLAQLHKVRQKIHKIAGYKENLDAKLTLVREVIFQSRDDISAVTPSVVYIHSAHLLVEIVTMISKRPNQGQLISPFFQDQNFTGKVPSDVFGLVELADRRLEIILKNLR